MRIPKRVVYTNENIKTRYSFLQKLSLFSIVLKRRIKKRKKKWGAVTLHKKKTIAMTDI